MGRARARARSGGSIMSNKMSIKFLVKILFPYFCSMGPENLLSLFICLSILMSRIKGVFVYQLKNEKK